jgi:replicative DNA helicase
VTQLTVALQGDNSMTEIIIPSQNIAIPKFASEMRDLILKTDTDFKVKQKVGLRTGFPLLDWRIGGIQERFYLIAGASSHGKTAWMLQMAQQMAEHNDDVYSLYISLDDGFSSVMPRVIASDMRIPSDAVSTPILYNNPDGAAILKKREDGIKNLLKRIDRFKIIGQESAEENVEQIVACARRHQLELIESGSKRRVVLFVDKFHDIKAESVRGDENEVLKFIAKELKNLTTKDGIPVITTAELRKLQGFARPTKADVRETVKTEYTCDVIFLVYNEYAVRSNNAQVYFDHKGEKQGVLEVQIAKNKVNGKQGRLFYELISDYCYLQEVPRERENAYTSRIN